MNECYYAFPTFPKIKSVNSSKIRGIVMGTIFEISLRFYWSRGQQQLSVELFITSIESLINALLSLELILHLLNNNSCFDFPSSSQPLFESTVYY